MIITEIITEVMSNSQFPSFRLYYRLAWLKLWDKHMTTGRINQVSDTSNEGRLTREHPYGALYPHVLTLDQLVTHPFVSGLHPRTLQERLNTSMD